MKIVWFKDGGAGGVMPEIMARLTDMVLFRAESIEDMPLLCAAHRPDMVVFDSPSPGQPESDCTDHLKRDFPNIKICIIFDAAHGSPMKKAGVLRADIVIPNSVSAEEFMLLFRYSQKDYRVFPKYDNDDRQGDQ